MSLAETLGRNERVILTAVIMLTVMMMTVDMSIAIIALPKIQSGLSASPDQIGWVLTSYMVAAAIATPLAGALAERFGFRRLYVMGIIGFGASSVLCGFATSLPQLVLFRALQGATGAMFQPLSQALLYDMYPPHRLGKAMSWFSIGVMAGPMIGPAVGGLITDVSSWRWLFFINGPLIGLALIGVLVYMPKVGQDHSRPFDFLGFAFLSLAVACIQLVFDRGEALDWLASREILLEIALAGLGFYLYAVHARTAEHPFINPKVFADRNVLAGLVLVFFIGVVTFVPISFLTLFVQLVLGFDVLETGLIQTPRAAVMAVFSFIIGNVAHRIPLRPVLVLGLFFTILGLWQLTFLSVDTSVSYVIWSGILLSLGGAMVFMPLNLISFATLAPEFRPMAMSIYSLLRQIGCSVGIAVMMTYVSRSTNDNLVRMVSGLSPYDDSLTAGGAGFFSLTDPASLKLLTLEIYRQASAIAYDNVFAVLTYTAAALIPFVILLRSTPQLSVATEAPHEPLA